MKKIILFLGLLAPAASIAIEKVQACQSSNDCMVIAEKCGHVGINKKYLKEVKAKKTIHLENCLGFLDPKRTQYTAACNQGLCEAVESKASR